MLKKPYEVKVTVHRQSNRTWQTTVRVEALSPGQAEFIAQGEAERLAADVDFGQFSEENVHYESEADSVKPLKEGEG